MDLFSAYKHGYRTNRITTIQSVRNTIMKVLNENKKVFMSNLDMNKAFDSIYHGIRLEKLWFPLKSLYITQVIYL